MRNDHHCKFGILANIQTWRNFRNSHCYTDVPPPGTYINRLNNELIPFNGYCESLFDDIIYFKSEEDIVIFKLKYS